MSTLQDGVYYIPELNFLTQNIFNSSKIKTALVKNDRAFIIDEKGKIFLLQNGKIQLKKKLNDKIVLGATLDAKNNLWISTEKWIYILDSSVQ